MNYVKTSIGELPVNYGHFALSQFSTMTGISMNDVFSMDLNKLSYEHIMTFLYIGLKDGARKEKVECKVAGVEAFCDLADDNKDLINELFTIFASYRKGEGRGDKKK
mgnify:CR=1 FL=1